MIVRRMPRLVADASNNQAELDLRALVTDVAGLYHKVTQGTGFVDRYFAGRRAQAARLRLPFGVYHFADVVHADPRAEAEHFLAHYHDLEPSALQPALDLETGTPDAHMRVWAVEWCRIVERELGVWPLIYSYGGFLAGLRAPRPIGGGLWLASYGRDDGADHPYFVPSPWRQARMHQFTSVGKLAGVPVRLDLSHTPRLPFARPLRALAHGFRP